MTARTVRIGGVPYGVGAPLVATLEGRDDCELHRAPPRQLIEELRRGALDAGLVSSIEAFRTPGYRACPGLGIACDGPVRSVRAFVRRGLAARGAAPARIGVDDGSETSVALLRILLADGLVGLPPVTPADGPEFERIAPTREPDALPHDVVLLIGDAGLEAGPGEREVVDLGATWKARTGLPFVFALWLFPSDAPATRIVPLLHDALRDAEAAGITDGTDGAVYHRIGDAELAGLERFRADAAALGLAASDIRPTFLTSSQTPPQ